MRAGRRARSAATRSTRRATSARARTARTSTDPALSPDATLAALRDGELDVIGRLVGSSNNAMVVRVRPPGTSSPASATVATSEAGEDDGDTVAVELGPGELLAVWKPTRGEQPLFDFPFGTLTRREVAAYLVSDATGWGIVPPTLLRDGPYGEGSIQQWIDVDETVDLVQLVLDADPRLRRIALFDAIVNNTDRKGGHLLPMPGGHIHAVDHGVTFSVVPKLRTLLWAWEGEPLEPEEVAVVERVSAALDGQLGADLRELLFGLEVDATRERVDAILAARVFPSPNPDWPAIPWPPF